MRPGEVTVDELVEEARRAGATVVDWNPGGTEPEDLSSLLSLSSPPEIESVAFYGLAGEIVEAIDPYSEADRVALLASTLVGFGSLLGSGRYAMAGGSRHPARLNVVLVGETSRARKGTAWALARSPLAVADPTWADEHIMGGLASGEGLIAVVRDGDADSDVSDKRLLVVEPEFARVLAVAQREGNTLSAIIRQAWDDGFLRTMTRHNPLRASGAHVSIVGHVTAEELTRRLSDTEAANGFANRFLFLSVRRSKTLPEGGSPPPEVIEDLGSRIAKARQAAGFGELRRTGDASKVWAQFYEEMIEGPAGLVGAITARAEAQTLRLSVAYALLDGSSVIDVPHLRAAYALWKYAESSATYIFGDRTGDDVADRLLVALIETHPSGLDRDAMYRLLGGHVSAKRLDGALAYLGRIGAVMTRSEPTGGRPRVVAYATDATARKAREARKGGAT